MQSEIDCFFALDGMLGGAPIDDADIAYYFSVDNVLSADDNELGTDGFHLHLEHRESSDESDPLVLPNGCKRNIILYTICY